MSTGARFSGGFGWAVLLLALACPGPARAVEAAARQFSMAPDDAVNSLRVFSDQSGITLFYLVNQVQGVRTNRVEGTLAGREVLDRMLEGTVLRAELNPATGVLAIIRAPAQAASVAAQPERGGGSRLLGTLGSIFTRPAPRQNAAGATAPGEVLRMNPFEISGTRDDSFRTMAVGSGSRLRLELIDTPASYSVINREFIDALGITDLAEAAGWATGQSFFASDNGGDNFGRPSQYYSRGSLTSQGGPDSFGAQRNFYQNPNNSGDSYAVESYDFGRGPNAALFGQGNGPASAGDASNGGLAGVSSLQTKRARLDSARTTVRLEVGSWNYRRATIDMNRPLTGNIGIRVNAVDFDRDGWRQLDMEATRGLTVAATWRLGQGLDLNAEVSTDRRRSRNTGAGQDERISGWDGSTVFRGPVTNAMFSGSATPGANNVANASYGTIRVLGLGNGVPGSSAAGLTFNGETSGVNRSGGARYLYDPYRGTVMNHQNMAITRRADETGRVPLWSSTAPNGAFFVRGTADIDGNADDRIGRAVSYGLGRSFYAKEGIPADIFTRAAGSSLFRFPGKRWVPTVDKPATEQRTKDFNMALTFTRGPLAIEVGGDINRAVNETRNWDNPQQALSGGRSATIDINQLRPDGTPNPGFLDMINTFPVAQSNLATDDATLRFNLGYTSDWGRWGNYVFNLQGSRATHDTDTRSLVASMRLNADSRRWQNEPVAIVLWGSDQVRAYKDPAGVGALSFTDVDWADPNNPVIQAPRVVRPAWVLTGFTNTRTVTDYALVQTTARWFGDRLVFTGALRRDIAEGRTRSALAQGDRPAGWIGELLWRPEAPADYFTMTYLQRDPATGLPLTGRPVLSGNRPRTTDPSTGLSIRDPLYAADRFRDDFSSPVRRSHTSTHSAGIVWHATRFLSPRLNFSSSYTPQTSATLDLAGGLRDLTRASGYDIGAGMRFFGDALVLNYNHYRQVRENDSFTPAAAAHINALYAANTHTDPDATDSGRNARGAAPLQGSDYQNRLNSGFEIDLSVHNLVPGLRISANGSSGWISNTDRGQAIRAYIPANAGLFRQILEDAGGMLDTTQRPADAPGAPGLAVANPAISPAFPGDRDAAVAAFNNLWIAHGQMLRERTTRVRTQPQMNLVVDHTLQRGRLRGLGISAGFQWQGRFVLFNRAGETILDPNQAVPTAIDNPVFDGNSFKYGTGLYNTQINLRYSMLLRSGTGLTFALRINNPVNDDSMGVSDSSTGGQGLGFGGGISHRQPLGDLSKPDHVLVGSQPSRFTEPINFRFSTTFAFGGGAPATLRT